MKKTLGKFNITDVLVLLLTMLLAMCVLMVLLLGAKSYRTVHERDQADYQSRTAAQYITMKVHQADRAGSVFVDRFEDADALTLLEEVDGEQYSTRIYYYDGYLCELYALAEDDSWWPQDGERILPAGGLTFEQTGSLITAECMDKDGAVQTFLLHPRSGKGEAQ